MSTHNIAFCGEIKKDIDNLWLKKKSDLSGALQISFVFLLRMKENVYQDTPPLLGGTDQTASDQIYSHLTCLVKNSADNSYLFHTRPRIYTHLDHHNKMKKKNGFGISYIEDSLQQMSDPFFRESKKKLIFHGNLPSTLTLCMLGKNFNRQHFEIFFLYFLEKMIWHFVQIVS